MGVKHVDFHEVVFVCRTVKMSVKKCIKYVKIDTLFHLLSHKVIFTVIQYTK